jgi:hypothetical protein
VLDLLAVRFRVAFGGFLGVMLSLQMTAVRHMRVMTSLLVVARLVVFSCHKVVLRSVLMVLGSLTMMFDSFLRHGNPPRPSDAELLATSYKISASH